MSDEIRSVDPVTGAEKGTKLARYDLIPVGPLRQLAEHFGKGARKYADNNWRKGYAWSKSYAALQRHLNAFWGGEDYDNHLPDCPADCTTHTESHHMAAVMWHAAALLEFTESHPAGDDRYTSLVSRGVTTAPTPAAIAERLCKLCQTPVPPHRPASSPFCGPACATTVIFPPPAPPEPLCHVCKTKPLAAGHKAHCRECLCADWMEWRDCRPYIPEQGK